MLVYIVQPIFILIDCSSMVLNFFYYITHNYARRFVHVFKNIFLEKSFFKPKVCHFLIRNELILTIISTNGKS